MSENIREIPLNSAEEVRDIAEDIAEMKAEEESEPVVLEEVKPAIKPKAKGCPKGALNKGPSKPRAKKIRIQQAPVEEESQAYEPSSPKRNLKLPTDPSSSDVAAAMLKLLQDQSYSRQSRKQRLYSSWFQQNLGHKEMQKKLDKSDHKYNEKLAKIRRANVERHAGYENTLKLRQNIQRFQRNATYDMELQRLRGATAHKRVEELKNILAK